MRQRRLSPPCARSKISSWRDGALYPLARGGRARRRIVPELEATAPAIPFWFYRVVAGAAELGGRLRQQGACNNAVRRLVLLYPLARGRRLDGTGLATRRTSGIQRFLPVKMPETGTFSKKTGRLLRKDGQLP